MTPGELYWVEFPPSDGHEQAGRRPAVVVSDDRVVGGLGVVLVVPVTGQPANSRFAATVVVPPSELNGLLKESVILVFQLRALDRRRFRGRIGVLERDPLTRVYAELDRLTGRGRTP